jgi:hypothetical protein
MFNYKNTLKFACDEFTPAPLTFLQYICIRHKTRAIIANDDAAAEMKCNRFLKNTVQRFNTRKRRSNAALSCLVFHL